MYTFAVFNPKEVYMEVNHKQLNDTQVQLEISLNAQDMQPYMEHTANHLSQARPIPGFRPGKAPLEVVKKHFGAKVVFREALDEIINGSLTRAVSEKKMRVFEEGEFKILEQTPESIKYTISFTILPEVKLGDWESKTLTRNEITVTEDEVKEAIADLSKMLAKEQVVERVAAMGDKTVLDFEVSVDGKVIDGGVGKSYPITLGDKKMIPGFEEAVVGHKAGDEFTFTLKFPSNYAANLGGKDGSFKIKVHSVMERILPEITDDLAKTLGEQDKNSLVARLKENIKADKADREQEKLEIEAVKNVVSSAQIGTIPEKAVDSETAKLTEEFAHDLSHQGLNFEGYLKTAGKTAEDIKTEFRPKALERVKTSLVMSQIIDENNLDVSPEELNTEVAGQREYLSRNNPQAASEVEKPEYRRYLYNRLLNRKAISFVAGKLIK